jgi:hypothetical protein
MKADIDKILSEMELEHLTTEVEKLLRLLKIIKDPAQYEFIQKKLINLNCQLTDHLTHARALRYQLITNP